MAEMPSVRVRGPGMSGGSVPSMPEAPRLTNRVNTVEGASTPYRIGAEAFGRVEAVAASINDKIAVADAQKAAFKAVTRDETGKLNVTFMPGGTLVAEAYNKGALSSYSAQFRQQTRAAGAELHQKNRRNPQGFQADWAARSEIALQNLDSRVLTESTLLMAEVGMQHSNSLLDDQYRESRVRQDGAIKAELNSAASEIQDYLMRSPNPESIDSPFVRDRLSEIEADLLNYVDSGFGTDDTSRAFRKALITKQAQAYAIGQANNLMGGIGVDDGVDFQERVSLITNQIREGSLPLGYEPLNAASPEDRFLAAQKFRQSQLSALAVNKDVMQEQAAQSLVNQARMSAEGTVVAARDGPEAMAVWLDAHARPGGGELIEMGEFMTPKTEAAMISLGARYKINLDGRNNAASADALFVALQTDMLQCSLEGSAEATGACGDRVLADAKAVTLDNGSQSNLLGDPNRIKPSEGLKLLKMNMVRLAKERTANESFRKAQIYVDSFGDGVIPLAGQSKLDEIAKRFPNDFDPSLIIKTTTDVDGNEVRSIDYDVLNRQSKKAAQRGVWTTAQVGMFQTVRHSKDGLMIQAAGRMFRDMHTRDGDQDFGLRASTMLSKGEGGLENYAFWQHVTLGMKEDVYDPPAAVAAAARANSRYENPEEVEAILLAKYPDGGGMGAHKTASADRAKEMLNENMSEHGVWGWVKGTFSGRRMINGAASSITAPDLNGDSFISRFFYGAQKLERTQWTDGFLFGEYQEPMTPQALALVNRVADDSIVLTRGEVNSTAIAQLQTLRANSAEVTPSGQLMLNGPGVIGVATARAAGIQDFGTADAWFSIGLQIKESHGVNMDDGLTDGVLEFLFGGDRDDNKIGTAISEGWLALDFKPGRDGQDSYYEVKARGRNGAYVTVNGKDGQALAVYPQHSYVNKEGVTHENPAYGMKKVLEKYAKENEWGHLQKAFWDSQLTEGIGWMLDEGGSIRNLARRLTDISFLAPNDSTGIGYLKDKIAVEMARSMASRYELNMLLSQEKVANGKD